MKNFLKSQKGINLITLSASVIIILILMGIILYNVRDNLGVQNLKNMQVDIENLRSKVANYYMQYGEIPVNKSKEYENYAHINVISTKVDTGKFYVIDLSAMENVTLTYGKDYEKITEQTTQQDLNQLEDLYIINETSHNIFYVKGIVFEGEVFYTDYTKENIDERSVELHLESSGENWSPIYQEEAIYKDENENTAKIPKGFQVSRKSGENIIGSGLVIKNGNTDDRYVWVAVPKAVFKEASSENDYDGIEKDLKAYTVGYRENEYEDHYYEGCGIKESEYNELKNKMLSSIYKNKGFWISQYEIGTDTIRNNATISQTDLKSKEGEYPYNYITIGQAQQLASNKFNSENITSSLLFGLQWDLMLKFIETTSIGSNTQITKDSTSWGNYKNSMFDINKGKYAITTWENVNGSYSKPTISVLLSTGATNRNSMLNIYDLAGNIEEWTLEQKIDSNNLAITRGGSYDDNGNEYFAAKRKERNIEDSNSDIGFRIALY